MPLNKTKTIEATPSLHAPVSSKLYKLLKRENVETAAPKVRNRLDTISRNCQSCLTFSVPSFRFRATIPPEDISFTREVTIDIIWLNKKAFLHVLDTDRNFQNVILGRDAHGRRSDEYVANTKSCPTSTANYLLRGCRYHPCRSRHPRSINYIVHVHHVRCIKYKLTDTFNEAYLCLITRQYYKKPKLISKSVFWYP